MRLNFSHLLLLCIISKSIIFSTNQTEDTTTVMMKKVISNIVSELPEMKKEINNVKASENISVAVNKIVQTGFNSFKEGADIQMFNGVDDENLDDFLRYLKGLIKLPQLYGEYFVENLSMLLYSDFNEILIYRVLFSVQTGGDCKYICVMGQRNSDDTTDWLVGDIRAKFTLAPDVLVIEKSTSSALGLYKTYKSEVIVSPKSISDNQLNILFKFFEVCMFEKFAELLNIDVYGNKKFLQ